MHNNRLPIDSAAGLTVLEHFACAAMQGLLTHNGLVFGLEKTADDAVTGAKLVLAKLASDPPG